MSYRRVMIFRRFSRNKLEKEKNKTAVTVANHGRTVPCKTGLDLGWTGSQVRGDRCLVSKFMDLFDTALQVQVPTVHFTQIFFTLWTKHGQTCGKKTWVIEAWRWRFGVQRAILGSVWLGIIRQQSASTCRATSEDFQDAVEYHYSRNAEETQNDSDKSIRSILKSIPVSHKRNVPCGQVDEC